MVAWDRIELPTRGFSDGARICYFVEIVVFIGFLQLFWF
jgi:hypothetical protein